MSRKYDENFLLLQYEREMLELRRAMEALQVKLNRAEERLFGHDTSSNGGRRDSDIFIPSAPSPNGGNSHSGSGSGTRDRLSLKSADENAVEMDHLLQRLLSAEEEMKREQELLSALDRKQKLIDAQEQKVRIYHILMCFVSSPLQFISRSEVIRNFM